MIARQTSGAEVQGLNPASFTMILMLKDQCFNIENLRVEKGNQPLRQNKDLQEEYKNAESVASLLKT